MPFSMTPVWEDIDFNVPQWIARPITMPAFYSGYRTMAVSQGIVPQDFDLLTKITPTIPRVRIFKWSYVWGAFFTWMYYPFQIYLLK